MPWWKRKPKAPPPEAETPFGRFVRDERFGGWDLLDGVPVSITVLDREGAPDPAFAARLPDLLARLGEYERLAREAYDFETAWEMGGAGPDSFVLHSLDQGEGDEDFVLAFGAEDGAADLGSVFVAFADGRVVDTVLAH